MNDSDHQRLLAVAEKWQRLYADERQISQALAEHNLSLQAELVALRVERDALRAVVSEMANMGTWLTFDDDDFYGVLRRAQDVLAARGYRPYNGDRR